MEQHDQANRSNTLDQTELLPSGATFATFVPDPFVFRDKSDKSSAMADGDFLD